MVSDRRSKNTRYVERVLFVVGSALLLVGMGLMVFSLTLPFILVEYNWLWRPDPYYPLVVYPILGQFFPVLFFAYLTIVLLAYSAVRKELKVEFNAALLASLPPLALLVLRALNAWQDATFTALDGFNLYIVALGVIWVSTLLSVAQNWGTMKRRFVEFKRSRVFKKLILLYFLLVSAISLQVAGLLMYFYGTLIMSGGQWVVYKPAYGFECFGVLLYYVALTLTAYVLCSEKGGVPTNSDRRTTGGEEASSTHIGLLAYSNFLFIIIPLSVISWVYSTNLGVIFPGWENVVLPGCYVFLVGCILFFSFALISSLTRRDASSSLGIITPRGWVTRNRIGVVGIVFFLLSVLMYFVVSFYEELAWLTFLVLPFVIGLDAMILLLFGPRSLHTVEAKYWRNMIEWFAWILPTFFGFILIPARLFTDFTWLLDPRLLQRLLVDLGNGALLAFLLFLADLGFIIILRRRLVAPTQSEA